MKLNIEIEYFIRLSNHKHKLMYYQLDDNLIFGK